MPIATLVHRAVCAAAIAGLSACAHVCPTGWEAQTSIEHSAYFGPSYGETVSLSGAIGRECREDAK